MVKYILIIFLLIFFASICLAAETEKKQTVVAEEDEFKKVEIGFFFGPDIPQFKFRNTIRDSFSEYWYWESAYGHTEYELTGNYYTSIRQYSKKSVGFGGFFNYFFHRDFGFQFMLERSSYNVYGFSHHGIYMSLDYYWGESDEYSGGEYADTTGRLTVMPISFNGVVRFDGGENISGYASGGLTYYKSDIEAEFKLGYSFPYLWHEYDSDLYYLLHDIISVPVSIDDSVSGMGGNFGVGIVFTFWEKVGIAADFRYYHGAKKDVYWMLRPGDYTHLINDWHGPVTKTLTQTDIDIFLEKHGELAKVEVNPSFFRLAFGLQFRF